MKAALDFNAVAVAGTHVWAVGRPGTVVFHSPDEGQTWEIQQTRQPLPLHAVHFLDDKRGWACGDLGTILATEDGGRTWKVCRQSGQRVAVLFVHASGKAVSLDAVAALGGDQGYYTAAVGVTQPAPAPAFAAGEADAEKTAAVMRSADPAAAVEPERITAALAGAAGRSPNRCGNSRCRASGPTPARPSRSPRGTSSTAPTRRRKSCVNSSWPSASGSRT